MKRICMSLCAASMALSFVGMAATGANSAPLPVVQQAEGGKLHRVQIRRDGERSRFERPRIERRIIERRRVERPRFEHRGNLAYFNRHRGYREYRRGYRHYNGWWFPPAAFIGGAVIGGAIASQPTVVVPATPAIRLSAAHVQWCQDRWKSYRVSDNSYQPYNGPRQACVSPYGG